MRSFVRPNTNLFPSIPGLPDTSQVVVPHCLEFICATETTREKKGSCQKVNVTTFPHAFSYQVRSFHLSCVSCVYCTHRLRHFFVNVSSQCSRATSYSEYKFPINSTKRPNGGVAVTSLRFHDKPKFPSPL